MNLVQNVKLKAIMSYDQRVLCKIYQVDVLKLRELGENTGVKLKTSALSPIKLQ